MDLTTATTVNEKVVATSTSNSAADDLEAQGRIRWESYQEDDLKNRLASHSISGIDLPASPLSPLPSPKLRTTPSLCFADRINIGNARLDNLQKELGPCGGIQYNHDPVILFPFYIAAETPSNMMLKSSDLVFGLLSSWCFGLLRWSLKGLLRIMLGWWRRELFSVALSADSVGVGVEWK